MLLVTKAVGDFLDTRGIADEAIRFNGYPFLDKDDHAYNIASWYYLKFHANNAYLLVIVSRVMRQELHTLPVTGFTIRDVGKLLRVRPSLL